jgi:hypothetical protein
MPNHAVERVAETASLTAALVEDSKMPIRQMILIVLLNLLFTTSAAYAGSCTEYIPKIVSLDTADPDYLAYKDRWTSVISPIINIANNPVTPLNILSDLSKHKLIEVRMAVAMNPLTPSDIKNALSSDETFHKIFEDNSRFYENSQISSSKYALQEERTIPAVTPRLITEVKEEIKIGKFNKQSIDVVKNPNLNKKDLEEFCQCKHYPILMRVAANPNITAECIQTLTKDFIKDGKLDLTIAFVKNGKIDLRDRKDYEVYSGRHYVTKSLLKNAATPTSILYSTLDYAKQYFYEDTLLHAAVLALLSRPDVPVNNILPYLGIPVQFRQLFRSKSGTHSGPFQALLTHKTTLG